MKSVVVGGSGFLGSHVADKLSDTGHEVVIYDLAESPYLRADQILVTGDIMDLEHLCAVIQGADYVYHFAGVADIQQAAEEPLKTIEYNILGTTYVLEACRRAG